MVGGVDTLFKDSSQEIQRYAANAYKTAGLSANEYMETISMETICEIKEIMSAYDVKNEDIVQLQVSRSKQIGHYHLMQAENPVWICSFEF